MSTTALPRSYYYLVTGLPDLVLAEAGAAEGCAAVMDAIADLMSPGDVELLQFIRLPFDNKNLITLLESRDSPHDPNGNLSRDELLQGIKAPEALPEHMQPLVEAQREDRQLFADLSREDQLNRLFFDAALEHPNGFISAWFGFELNLRNVLAALSIRHGPAHLDGLGESAERRLAACVICSNDIAEQIMKSTAPDFGLSSNVAWVERLVDLPPGGGVDREKAIDRIRWDMLDELAGFAGFGVESILAFCLKLFIVERWSAFDAVGGKARLEQLVAQMARWEEES